MSRPTKDSDVAFEAADQAAGPNASPARGRPLDTNVQNALGRELKAMYEEVVSEPVPDRFLELLKKLEERE